jgi:AraC-like DNA-binding protein
MSIPIPPLEGSIVQTVVLVDRITRSQTGHFQSTSLPGHLLHYVSEGEVKQTVCGQMQYLRPGNVVWYGENDPIQGHVLRTPWTFFTVNFLAPRLPPPPYEERVWPVGRRVPEMFQTLWESWEDEESPPAIRHLRVFKLLMELLIEVLPARLQMHRSSLPTKLWWEIEAKIREDLSQPFCLESLEKISHRSRIAITQACKLATGVSPMKRLKELRLSYARSLVLYSKMSMTEIACWAGYGRAQEFSRDYHRHFGASPKRDRVVGPNYQAVAINPADE